MKASIVDLRYRMKDVLRSIERNESVTILYHGKKKAMLIPASEEKPPALRVADHPFFGMDQSDEDVSGIVERLRGGRYRDL